MVFLPEPNDRYCLDGTTRYSKDIGYLLKARCNPVTDPGGVLRRMRVEFKKRFDPSTDYLCMTGSALCCSLSLAAALTVFEEIKVLLFDAKHNQYRERKLAIRTNESNDHSASTGPPIKERSDKLSSS